MPAPTDENASHSLDERARREGSSNTSASASNNASTSSPSSIRSSIRTNPVFAFQLSPQAKKFVKDHRTEIAAGSSSIISTTVSFPLDFVKSRMQSYETGFRHTIKDAYKAEGLRAFWKGVLPPLVSVTIVRTFSFTLYQKTKYFLDGVFQKTTGQSPLVIANAPGSYPTFSTVACFGMSGAVAGAIITTVSCPFELTKLNEQLAGKVARDAALAKRTANNPNPAWNTKSSGPFRTASRLVRDRGWRGLYAGYRLHLLRDVIGTSVYFITYESVKQLMGNARGKSSTSPLAVTVAGGLCGIVSWAIIYPVDVAKTVYQKKLLAVGSNTASPPAIEFFKRTSYRGLGVSCSRSALLNAIFFSSFERIKKQINALEV